MISRAELITRIKGARQQINVLRQSRAVALRKIPTKAALEKLTRSSLESVLSLTLEDLAKERREYADLPLLFIHRVLRLESKDRALVERRAGAYIRKGWAVDRKPRRVKGLFRIELRKGTK